MDDAKLDQNIEKINRFNEERLRKAATASAAAASIQTPSSPQPQSNLASASTATAVTSTIDENLEKEETTIANRTRKGSALQLETKKGNDSTPAVDIEMLEVA
jgi:hypothetical protein